MWLQIRLVGIKGKTMNQTLTMSTSSVNKEDVVVEVREQNKPYIDLDWEPQNTDSLQYKIRKFIWDGTGKHPKEQKYLLKLDFFLLSSSMLGYFIKNLNQSNVKTAYVNGMEEYFGMTSNQYNYLLTIFTVGYIIGQIPSNLILHRISARFYLGGLEVCWSILTVAMIGCKNLKGMYAIRFLIGFLESGYFPGLEYLLGSNYSAPEITTRSVLFALSGHVAGLISGPLQLAILRRFSSSSLPPFKWLFVFDAVISFPIGIYTMFSDPNTPSTTDVWYFTEEDKLVGLERRRRIGAQLNTREKYTIQKIKTFFNTWHIWVFPIVFLCFNNSAAAWGQPSFELWMKQTLKLGPEKYNVYPSYVTTASIVLTLILAWTHNYVGGTYNHLVVGLYFVMVIFGCGILSVWDVGRGIHWVAYISLGLASGFGQPFIFSWINRLLFHNDMKRNFVVVVTNTLAYVTGAWVPILVWNTTAQPRSHIGFTYTACLSSVGILATSVAFYFTRRDTKRKEDLSDSEKEPIDIE